MVSRSAWSDINAIHGVVYFAPEAAEAYGSIGIGEGWPNYFASRSAALGRASAELVTAVFYGWSPDLVHQHVPAVWDLAEPEDVLPVRLDVARSALSGIEDLIGDTAATLLATIDGLDFAGKPLAAAQAALPRPADPIGGLWHATTVLREFRGDCHWSVIAAAGLNGVAANTLDVATGRLRPSQQRRTGWSDGDWSAGFHELQTRGWVDAERSITAAGTAAREQMESATDRVTIAGLDNEARARLLTAEESIREIATALRR